MIREMEIFDKKIKSYGVFLKEIENYVKIIKPMFPDKKNEFDNLNKYMTKSWSEMKKISQENIDLKKYTVMNTNTNVKNKMIFVKFSIFNRSRLLENYIHNIIKEDIYTFSKNIDNKILSHLSQTYSTNTYIKYNELIASYSKFKKINSDLNESCIVSFSDYIYLSIKKIENEKEIIREIDRIHDIFIENYYSVSLYAFILQKLLDFYIPSKNLKIHRQIINNIEKSKDFILLKNDEVNDINKKPNNNPPYKTFGLITYGKLDNLDQIISGVTKNRVKNENENDLRDLAKKINTTIIIFYKCIKNPILFDIQNLIIPDKNSKTYSQNSGINNDFIKKFDIIKYIKGESSWDFSIKYYGDIDSNSNIICIEKLNKDKYRLLCNELKDDFNGIMQKDDLSSMIKYIKSTKIKYNKTRVSKYNDLIIEKAASNIFLGVKFDTREINLYSQIVDSKYIRNEIYMRIFEEFTKIIKNNYKDGNMIKKQYDFSKIIHHDNLIDKFSEVIMEQYYNYVKKDTAEISKFLGTEIFSTFISNIFIMNRIFIRSIHDNFTKVKMDNSIFKLNNDMKVKKLSDIFGEILDRTLVKLVSNKSNIFQSMIFKNKIVNLSII